jgi:hypothetical protein
MQSFASVPASAEHIKRDYVKFGHVPMQKKKRKATK